MDTKVEFNVTINQAYLLRIKHANRATLFFKQGAFLAEI